MMLGIALFSGGDSLIVPTPRSKGAIAWFDTKALFKASLPLPAGYYSEVCVHAVTGTYPPAPGTDATQLCYRPVGSSTGIWGETTVNGIIYDPIYSTNPVKVGEFGLVPDGYYAYNNGGLFNATSTGGTTITVSSTTGCVAGDRVSTIQWATALAASLPIIPSGTKIVSVGSGTLTLDTAVPAMTSVPSVCWADIMTGTDNYPAIQAALNFAIQNPLSSSWSANQYSRVEFPNGQFLINSMLSAGWGNAYVTLNISGTSGRGSTFRNGTTLLAGTYNQPAIDLEGSQNSALGGGIRIVGRNTNFAFFQSSSTPNPADWVAPEFSPSGAAGGVNQYAPMAGVVVDAFCASAPTTAYTTPAAPTWTGITTQYGRPSLSSNGRFKDLFVSGFGVDIVSGLGNCGNGDFMDFEDVNVSNAAYGVAVENTQSRNVTVKNIIGNKLHSVLTDSHFGVGEGTYQGPITNLSASHVYELFDFKSLVYSAPLVISNTYVEASTRIGDFTGSAATVQPVIFQGGNLALGYSALLPASYITNDGPITLSGVSISGNARIGNWSNGTGLLKFEDGGTWNCALASSPSSSQITALNYSGGCLAGSPRFHVNGGGTLGSNLSVIDPVTVGFWGGSSTTRPMINIIEPFGGNARLPLHQAMRQYRDEDGRLWNATLPPEYYFSWTDTSRVGTPPTITNDQLTFGFCSNYQVNQQPFNPGDIIYDATGTIFVVNTVGSPTSNSNCSGIATSVLVTATQQNNLYVTNPNGGNTFASNNISAATLSASPAIHIQGPQIQIPMKLFYGAFTSASASIASVQSGNGVGSDLASYFVAGDRLWGVGGASNGGCSIYGASGCVSWPIPSGGLTAVSSVTAGNPGSITLGANALSTGTFPIFPFEINR
jgi:hypothetical protein